MILFEIKGIQLVSKCWGVREYRFHDIEDEIDYINYLLIQALR